MAKRMSSDFYELARIMRDIEVLSSGDPEKIMKRIVNKIIGRKIVSKIWVR